MVGFFLVCDMLFTSYTFIFCQKSHENMKKQIISQYSDSFMLQKYKIYILYLLIFFHTKHHRSFDSKIHDLIYFASLIIKKIISLTKQPPKKNQKRLIWWKKLQWNEPILLFRNSMKSRTFLKWKITFRCTMLSHL